MAGTKRFFKFCRERHSIFLRREAGLPREQWTTDPILSKYKFTNVYRELDRTTAWFRHFVRDPLRDKPEVMLATVLFRMFNRIEVGEAIFCQSDLFDSGNAWNQYVDTGNLSVLKRAIVAHVGKTGPYATGAYIISSPPGLKKLDGILKVVDDFHKRECKNEHCGYEDWHCVAKHLIAEPERHNMERVWSWLRGFDYLGNFHSYEIACDLRYTKLLESASDRLTWCSPGPGARRGMNRIDGADKDRRVPVDELVASIEGLLVASTSPGHWPQPKWNGNGHFYRHHLRPVEEQWPAWEMREVEHSLCEFDKYERVLHGEGRPRGVYR
jgi:hypothetical protein